MSSSLWRTEDRASYKSRNTIANEVKKPCLFLVFKCYASLYLK